MHRGQVWKSLSSSMMVSGVSRVVFHLIKRIRMIGATRIIRDTATLCIGRPNRQQVKETLFGTGKTMCSGRNSITAEYSLPNKTTQDGSE